MQMTETIFQDRRHYENEGRVIDSAIERIEKVAEGFENLRKTVIENTILLRGPDGSGGVVETAAELSHIVRGNGDGKIGLQEQCRANSKDINTLIKLITIESVLVIALVIVHWPEVASAISSLKSIIP
jgi:hypothetical protein